MRGRHYGRAPLVTERQGQKIFKENQKNLLTNHSSCDTIRMSKGKSEYQAWEKFLWQSRGSEVPPHRLGKAKKKNVKNLLTNPLKCDTIRVQKDRGWEQTRKLWSATHQKKN